MLLRSKIHSVKPIDDGSCKREFVVTSRQDVKRKVYDENGEFIREITDFTISREPIPLSEKMHIGQTSDMYSIGVLQDAGVQTKLVTSFDRSSLDENSNFLDEIETLTEKDFETLSD